MLAVQAPNLHNALLAAKAAGYDYVLLDCWPLWTSAVRPDREHHLPAHPPRPLDCLTAIRSEIRTSPIWATKANGHVSTVGSERWFLDAPRMRQLAADNQISYTDLHEGIDVLAARSPSLYGALLAAKAAGHDT